MAILDGIRPAATLLMMDISSMLEAGRLDFLQAIGSPREGATGWSVVECIEHVVMFEERYIGWLERGTPVLPRPDPDRELRMYTAIRSRLTKVESPEAMRPRGRFDDVGEALAAFNAVRTRTVRLVQELGREGLYSRGAKHPFFGRVNGVELIYLIDGHARRHADQMREICEEADMKKTPVFKRDRPDLPSEWEMSLAEDSRNMRAEELRLDGAVFERVALAGSQFGSVLWKDVRFVDCDLANVRAHRMTLVRVEFINCRLTGLVSAVVDWRDVLISGGDLRYAQLQGGKFRSCEFDNCNWEESDLQNADMEGSIFRSCNLAQADFRRAKLNHADLRKSEVEGLTIGMNDLRGAIVDPAQAMVFARLMGLQIR
ncbi:MAG TPA: pentapeptide repeat-containing protein [Bryobacteraceae bacterium]|nr:pentapeptide repeat-containing protein [Bryobacteraceae bacterium]